MQSFSRYTSRRKNAFLHKNNVSLATRGRRDLSAAYLPRASVDSGACGGFLLRGTAQHSTAARKGFHIPLVAFNARNCDRATRSQPEVALLLGAPSKKFWRCRHHGDDIDDDNLEVAGYWTRLLSQQAGIDNRKYSQQRPRSDRLRACTTQLSHCC